MVALDRTKQHMAIKVFNKMVREFGCLRTEIKFRSTTSSSVLWEPPPHAGQFHTIPFPLAKEREWEITFANSSGTRHGYGPLYAVPRKGHSVAGKEKKSIYIVMRTAHSTP